MLRDRLVRERVGAEEGFTWRGAEVSRMEGFSDAVFAFATQDDDVPKGGDVLVCFQDCYADNRQGKP